MFTYFGLVIDGNLNFKEHVHTKQRLAKNAAIWYILIKYLARKPLLESLHLTPVLEMEHLYIALSTKLLLNSSQNTSAFYRDYF